MPIKVSCHCGQSFTAKDDLAGQTLLCPKCSQPLTIPSPNDRGRTQQHHAGNVMEELFDEVGMKAHKGPRCPQCGAPMKPNTLLCTSCGFNTQTGEKVAGAKIHKAGERGHAESTETLLERAAFQIEADKLEQKKNESQGLPWWIYFLAFSMLTGFVITMFMIPKDQAFLVTGMCLAGFGGLMVAYYGLRLAIAAFLESVACGLLYLFLPFYALYYLITRWDRVGNFFLMQLVYSVVIGAGAGLMALAPMMAEENKAAQSIAPSAVARADFAAEPMTHRRIP